MSHKEEKKPLLKRVIEREEINFADYSLTEIEQVIHQLAESHIDKVRTEEAIRLIDAIGIGLSKVRAILEKEERN